jgi:perosamine synthetase
MGMSLAENICNALRQVCGEDGPSSLHEPTFNGNEWRYVKDALDSTFVSSVGKYVDQFEGMLTAYTGAKRAVAVVNGTAALHMGLLLAGVKAEDEVLVPALTFVATANAVSYCRAVPHFVDSEPTTLGMDIPKLGSYLKKIVVMQDGLPTNRLTGKRLKAIVPMHTFGHPVDLEPLLGLSEAYTIPIIEDAAESLGSFYQGIHTGNFGILGILSFNGNKTITTGGGGAIITNDGELADLAKHLTTTAKRPHKWEYFHDQIGYNYRLPNLNAALGCAQMEALPKFLVKKRELSERYRTAFSEIEGVTFFQEPNFVQSNYWLNTILLNEENRVYRDDILGVTNRAGYMTRPAWTLMHKLPMYSSFPRMDLSVAEDLAARIINIPSTPR